ncbi:MAG: ABC transporter ATP-binding protein [Rhodobiaceae bacterium]|nr:ABC transporter ATP-binding protein [Rhodobiaceae bacterium]MCC0056610.1 ABC transporter ATP-binding protein [Rhodobiaceae bacterium]
MSNVSIKNLHKNYGSFHAVKGIDLEIAEGEFLVLLGPSGCGKTTTLRCVAGLEEVTDGQISIGDRVVSSKDRSVPPEHREIGMVFQSYAIWPHMTVFDNVAFGLKLQRIPSKQIRARVMTALEMVGLEHLADRGASQLSGGQQQRVALARAIVLEPKVLLFDEPLSNLDAKLRERMRFELRQLLQQLKITSIYVTHDQQEAMVVADRIVLMNEGVIEQIGNPAEIYRAPSSRFSAEFIGLTNIMSGRVSKTGKDSALSIQNGPELRFRNGQLKKDTDVDIVFRPEVIEISKAPLKGPNTFKATVESVFFLGNIGDIYLRVGDMQVRGQLSPPVDWKLGEEAWVRIPPEWVLAYPAQG